MSGIFALSRSLEGLKGLSLRLSKISRVESGLSSMIQTLPARLSLTFCIKEKVCEPVKIYWPGSSFRSTSRLISWTGIYLKLWWRRWIYAWKSPDVDFEATSGLGVLADSLSWCTCGRGVRMGANIFHISGFSSESAAFAGAMTASSYNASAFLQICKLCRLFYTNIHSTSQCYAQPTTTR